MGRAPCCDKANVKRGPWSPEEDAKLKSYIEHHGTGGNWIALPQKIGLKRCGKSCRLRWLNYLRPNIKHGGFSEEEDNIICSLYVTIGSRWSVIAAQLPGRTDNDIKNYWNTRLKKKLLGKHLRNNKDQHHPRRSSGNKMFTTTSTSLNNNKQKQHHDSSSLLLLPQISTSPTIINDNHYSNINYNNIMMPALPPTLSSSSSSFNLINHQSHHHHQATAAVDSIRNLLIKLGGRFGDNDDGDGHDLSTNTHNTHNPHHHQVLLQQDMVDGGFNSQFPDGAVINDHNNSTQLQQFPDQTHLYCGLNDLVVEEAAGSIRIQTLLGVEEQEDPMSLICGDVVVPNNNINPLTLLQHQHQGLQMEFSYPQPQQHNMMMNIHHDNNDTIDHILVPTTTSTTTSSSHTHSNALLYPMPMPPLLPHYNSNYI